VSSTVPASLDALLARHAASAAAMSPAASYYWARHAGRFRCVLTYLDEQARAKTRTVLDVGGSFQTPLLAKFFPEWQIDTLADIVDERFALPAPSRHFRFDLNAAADAKAWPQFGTRYDLIVFMEVVEHLAVPPAQVLRFLAAQLNEGGAILLTTPNAAWLKNRLKLMRGKNPFELLREDRSGHIREYTLDELKVSANDAGLRCRDAKLCGLYDFAGAKDRFYNAVANAAFPGLRRSIFMVLERA
jgi:2-polyprenyl-3-methyl-5-hydroxy-6-metoxy-1,4-benzoquinol methylase